MSLSSLFRSGGKYFNKNIEPKCDYCQFGKRAKDGNKVLCEKRGMVDASFSCNKFSYSPLKRIPVKQLKFVGSLADDEIYIETADDKVQPEQPDNTDVAKGQPAKNADTTAPNVAATPTPQQPAPQNNVQPVEAQSADSTDHKSQNSPEAAAQQENPTTHTGMNDINS